MCIGSNFAMQGTILSGSAGEMGGALGLTMRSSRDETDNGCHLHELQDAHCR